VVLAAALLPSSRDIRLHDHDHTVTIQSKEEEGVVLVVLALATTVAIQGKRRRRREVRGGRLVLLRHPNGSHSLPFRSVTSAVDVHLHEGTVIRCGGPIIWAVH
jgi:hypothetical protein